MRRIVGFRAIGQMLGFLLASIDQLIRLLCYLGLGTGKSAEYMYEVIKD